ncbi:hypothetical protein HX92_4114 [Mycobacterium tuberculosis]|uniref:Uncharacterized protein n=1 Tax=Mycobacterium tuberculosis (strain CDC 1551 / Oshkosh) TaxID=83331 RepID=Q8VK66_MYCTO|nr:hypothetical protein MT1166 [Mycobacterium tuberculosis CDC1551]AGL99635.1 hypothetical protein CFBS_1203 [Mycobacterium tuberculosis CCDC5079]AHJ41849.1 hypothetical protein HKBS1_1203 [Mycobacterium tuberculosis HKBS1]AHJ46004.1 hypothetical protein HKBT2_1207 [Mycobacterium tuberculosis BT2]AHJ50147.1 hypothetical protein HKBT1_1201 [Mycobacterium tuberculosis BT1]AHJ54290.1 hypothetical protein CFBR_1205 [Mycobacterium tuberculosis CCDC5180]AIB47741.1 hypothetical protein MTBK_11950 [M
MVRAYPESHPHDDRGGPDEDIRRRAILPPAGPCRPMSPE